MMSRGRGKRVPLEDGNQHEIHRLLPLELPDFQVRRLDEQVKKAEIELEKDNQSTSTYYPESQSSSRSIVTSVESLTSTIANPAVPGTSSYRKSMSSHASAVDELLTKGAKSTVPNLLTNHDDSEEEPSLESYYEEYRPNKKVPNGFQGTLARGEKWMNCPYDKSHWFLKETAHLFKCRRNYEEKLRKENKPLDILVCPYHTSHHIPSADLEDHMIECRYQYSLYSYLDYYLEKRRMTTILKEKAKRDEAKRVEKIKQVPLPSAPSTNIVGRGRGRGRFGKEQK